MESLLINNTKTSFKGSGIIKFSNEARTIVKFKTNPQQDRDLLMLCDKHKPGEFADYMHNNKQLMSEIKEQLEKIIGFKLPEIKNPLLSRIEENNHKTISLDNFIGEDSYPFEITIKQIK